jgi:hypothetical protein
MLIRVMAEAIAARYKYHCRRAVFDKMNGIVKGTGYYARCCYAQLVCGVIKQCR